MLKFFLEPIDHGTEIVGDNHVEGGALLDHLDRVLPRGSLQQHGLDIAEQYVVRVLWLLDRQLHKPYWKVKAVQDIQLVSVWFSIGDRRYTLKSHKSGRPLYSGISREELKLIAGQHGAKPSAFRWLNSSNCESEVTILQLRDVSRPHASPSTSEVDCGAMNVVMLPALGQLFGNVCSQIRADEDVLIAGT